MQEPIDHDYSEFLTREEELLMQDKEDLIKHILRLELENSELRQDIDLPW
jgi:hypothetical protein